MFNTEYLCTSWGKAEVRRQGAPESRMFLRAALEEVIPLIRFSRIPPKDFHARILPAAEQSLLTPEEVAAVLVEFCASEDHIPLPTTLLNSKPRVTYIPRDEDSIGNSNENSQEQKSTIFIPPLGQEPVFRYEKRKIKLQELTTRIYYSVL